MSSIGYHGFGPAVWAAIANENLQFALYLLCKSEKLSLLIFLNN